MQPSSDTACNCLLKLTGVNGRGNRRFWMVAIGETAKQKPRKSLDLRGYIWRRGSESNRRRRICNPLHNHFATPPLTGASTRLYLIDLNFGAGNEARTRDLNLGKVALYQLSYSRVANLLFKFDAGAGNEARTRDLNLGKVALYQLSYSRIADCFKLVWSGKRGSNSRPQPWQGCALPTELFPHHKFFKHTGAGNEARTRDLNLGKVALYQLSYSRIANCFKLTGAGNEARTRDLNLGKVALYQLSYSRAA